MCVCVCACARVHVRVGVQRQRFLLICVPSTMGHPLVSLLLQSEHGDLYKATLTYADEQVIPRHPLWPILLFSGMSVSQRPHQRIPPPSPHSRPLRPPQSSSVQPAHLPSCPPPPPGFSCPHLAVTGHLFAVTIPGFGSGLRLSLHSEVRVPLLRFRVTPSPIRTAPPSGQPSRFGQISR